MYGVQKRSTPFHLLFKRHSIKYTSASRLRWQGAVFSVACIAGSTALLFFLELAPYNVNMVYMLVTLFATVWFGLGSGVIAAVLAFLCFDFFFIPPYFTFVIDAFQGWTAVFLFFGTALFANQVAGRARRSSQEAEKRAKEATSLYEMATTVIVTIDQTEMLLAVTRKVNEALGGRSCTLYLADPEREGQLVETVRVEKLEVGKAGRHPDPSLAQTAFNRQSISFFPEEVHFPEKGVKSLDKKEPDQDSPAVTLQLPVAYIPIRAGDRPLGVLVVVGQSHTEDSQFDPEEKRLIQVFANHIALAVEHSRLIQETALIATLRDADKVKSAILASVSHELRTPLTAIKTFTANLLDRTVEWSEEERQEFLEYISRETDRLTRLVANILDLTRIEAGTLKPNFGWYYTPEIIETVVGRLQSNPLFKTHPLSIKFDREIGLTRLDYVQIDQVLTNLLENAAKYSPEGRPVTVQVEVTELPRAGGRAWPVKSRNEHKVLLVKVLDEGIGIPAEQRERIFDKFYRVKRNGSSLAMDAPGVGIGLTIARGIVEAHGGEIWAEPRLYGGTIFNFTLPVIELKEEPIPEHHEEFV